MVPFGVPYIRRHLIFRVFKKGPNFDNSESLLVESPLILKALLAKEVACTPLALLHLPWHSKTVLGSWGYVISNKVSAVWLRRQQKLRVHVKAQRTLKVVGHG